MAVNFQFLRLIRERELSQVLPWIPPGSRVLEIGAGAGWQARRLAAIGHTVTAIDVDVEELGYVERRVWPVVPYDGVHIPCADHHFDVIFSSNVLEHIAHFDSFQAEIKRVLRPGGVAIHVVPSGAWRFWTTVTYYVDLFNRMLAVRQRARADRSGVCREGSGVARRTDPAGSGRLAGGLAKVARVAYPRRHGEQGNALSEVLWLSRWGWDRRFLGADWQIEACFPNRLFYTGYFILGPCLDLSVRRNLSYVLGSACLVYVLVPGDGTKKRAF